MSRSSRSRAALAVGRVVGHLVVVAGNAGVRSPRTDRARAYAQHVAIGDLVRPPTCAPHASVGRAAGNVEEYGSPIHRHDARSPAGAPARQGGAARHQHLDVSRAPRSACSASTAPGKSTLLRIIAGEDDGYQRRSAGSRPASRVGYLPQEPQLDPTKDVLGNVTDGVAAHEGPARPVRGGLQRDGRARRRLRQAARRAVGAPGQDRRGQRLGPRPPARDRDGRAAPARRADADVDEAVAAASAAGSRCAGCCSSKPDLLLLDEPTNHLDAESVAWLERHLQEYHGTVVAVTHDRYFLDNVAGWILELDRGYGIPWEGNYSSWLEQKEQRLAQEEKVDETRRRTLAARARVDPHGAARPPGQGQGAHQRVRQARRGGGVGRARARRSCRSRSRPARGSAISWSRPSTCARATATGCSIDDLSFSLPPGGIVGVIGANGAGKTTLFRMLVGQEPPDGGSLEGRPDRASSRTSTSRASRSTPTRPSTRRSPAASTI